MLVVASIFSSKLQHNPYSTIYVSLVEAAAFWLQLALGTLTCPRITLLKQFDNSIQYKLPTFDTGLIYLSLQCFI